MTLTCFKAYDVRGRLGENLDECIAQRIGAGFAEAMKPGHVVVGHDARESSPSLKAALITGLTAQGVDVTDIGLCGTEEVYFATAHLGAGGGIMVTASHNPIDYNGMKLVGPGSRPIDPATELAAIRAAAESDHPAKAPRAGTVTLLDTRADFSAHVTSLVDGSTLGPLKIVANAGNGTAGLALEAILARLAAQGAQLDVIRLQTAPDASFPNGIPNPLLPENRAATADVVRETGADLGLAWDGDFDRCFFFDETGAFVDGEYLVALLARASLLGKPGARIVHDPRVIWATQDIVASSGGEAVVSKTGHAFVKATMREAGAIYGGEMSAHHYFADFFYCDSGMIPWLKIVEVLSAGRMPMSALVGDLRSRFPSSGEINFKIADVEAATARVLAAFPGAEIDRIDGLSLGFPEWRLNLRASNTEPLLRLNVETRGDAALLTQKVDQISALITAQ